LDSAEQQPIQPEREPPRAPDWIALRASLLRRLPLGVGAKNAEDLVREAILRGLAGSWGSSAAAFAAYCHRALDGLLADFWRARRRPGFAAVAIDSVEATPWVTAERWAVARASLLRAAEAAGMLHRDALLFVRVRFDEEPWNRAGAEIGLDPRGLQAAQRRISRMLSDPGCLERLYGQVQRALEAPLANPQPPIES
jgi:hypothetical protein